MKIKLQPQEELTPEGEAIVKRSVQALHELGWSTLLLHYADGSILLEHPCPEKEMTPEQKRRLDDGQKRLGALVDPQHFTQHHIKPWPPKVK